MIMSFYHMLGNSFWLALCTRPDIAKSATQLESLVSLQSKSIVEVIYKLYDYIRQTRIVFINFKRGVTLDIKL